MASRGRSVGVGLFMGRGAGKPRDLEIKLSALEQTPAVIDHLILLRPDDDVSLTGKSKAAWQESERRGRQTRLEPASLASFAALYAFPRWLTALGEALPPGQALPNLADPAAREVDSNQARIPYVQYHQDL